MPLSDRHRQLIDQAKAAQRSQQLARAQKPPDPIRIGDRDPVTGQHTATYPDGSQTTQGRKLYDAHANKGDSVTGLPVEDGTIGLLGPKGQASPLAPPAKEGVRGIATSGPLKTNEVGYLRGQVWNYEEPEAKATGKIKYLYSIVSSGSTVFYVAGWQQKSVLVKTFDSSHVILSASLDNLGSNKWSANFSYQKGGKYYVEFKPSSGEGWLLESPVPAVSYGHGFWRATRQTRNDSGQTSTGGSPGGLMQTIYAIQETDFWYAWKGETVTQHQTTYDLFNSGTVTYFDDGSVASTVGGGYDRAIYDLIFLPLDDRLTGKTFPYYINNTNTLSSANDNARPVANIISASSVCASDRNINALLKINAQGLVGVGINATYNVSEAAGLNQFYGACQGGITYTYSTRYAVNGADISTDTTNLEQYYLDVFSSVTTGIKRSPTLYTGTATERNKKVAVSTFNSTFQQSQKQYPVFKPSVLGNGFIFRSASYHP